MEGLGFWIFVGLFMAATIWTGSREKLEKHKTLQRMLERNEEIDEDLVNRLLDRRAFGKPGDAYRACRAIGAFVMVASIAVGVVASAIAVTDENAVMAEVALIGAVSLLTTFFVGLGLFIASRFCEKPGQSHEKE